MGLPSHGNDDSTAHENVNTTSAWYKPIRRGEMATVDSGSGVPSAPERFDGNAELEPFPSLHVEYAP